MNRQTGASILSFLMAFMVASTLLAICLPPLGRMLTRLENGNEFELIASETLTALKANIADHWETTGCRALPAVPPTLVELVNKYNANPVLLSTKYDIKMQYNSKAKSTSSSIKLTMTPPPGMSPFDVLSNIPNVADDYRITNKTVVLYKYISAIPITSELQQRYYSPLGDGCMEKL